MSFTQGLENIADSLGYLVLNEEGAVLSSGGELENDERTASVIIAMLHTAIKIPTATDRVSTFKRLSVIWDKIQYAVTISNHRIYVTKRRYINVEPVTA